MRGTGELLPGLFQTKADDGVFPCMKEDSPAGGLGKGLFSRPEGLPPSARLPGRTLRLDAALLPTATGGTLRPRILQRMGGGEEPFQGTRPAGFTEERILAVSHSRPDLRNLSTLPAAVFINGHFNISFSPSRKLTAAF